MARTIRLLIAGALTMAINAPASTEENFKQLKRKPNSGAGHRQGYHRWRSLVRVLPQGRRPRQRGYGDAADRHLENPGGQALQIRRKEQTTHLLRGVDVGRQYQFAAPEGEHSLRRFCRKAWSKLRSAPGRDVGYRTKHLPH